MSSSDPNKDFESDYQYKPGVDPEIDAWYTAFFLENHLDPFAYPDQVATPEQTGFIVHPDNDERYYPCSDMMFNAIMDRNKSSVLQQKYNLVLDKIIDLIRAKIVDKNEREFLESLIRIKFRHETRDEIMIPSRLEKRLLKIFLNRTLIEDPFQETKAERNLRAKKILSSAALLEAVNNVDPEELENPPSTLTKIRERLEYIELKRLITLTGEPPLWLSDTSDDYTKEDFLRIFRQPLSGNGVNKLFKTLGTLDKDHNETKPSSRKILWLANEAGEFMVDLAIIKYLNQIGHKVIVAFKEGPLFTQVTIADTEADEELSRIMEHAYLIKDKNLSKNNLVDVLRRDSDILYLSDGTHETLNLALTSTTFARIFKEVDLVISRGETQKQRLFDTHFRFTQDIFNISSYDSGEISISFKAKHPEVIKFSHTDLEQKAKDIIDQMENAKKNGMTVTFYSGIIGSIPGKIDVAKKIMSTFIKYLEDQSSKTFIINPSRYYEPGMDADDLMYMWEIVQRSGLIDIWRFQSYEDIAKSFELLNQKVPPEWVGKDSTYSTGCTKEMNIAIDVLRKHPEMQLIGPSKEKFMRRENYGVGKMYDQRLIG